MRRILKYLLKEKWLLIIGTMAMVFIILIDQVTPMLQKIIVDRGIINQEYAIIPSILLGFLIVTLLKAIFGYGKEFLYDYISAKVHYNIRTELFSHIQSFEFDYFDKTNTGELMSRIGEDIENIWQTISFGLRMFVENILYFSFSTVILFYLNWKLTVICLLILSPIGILAYKLENKLNDGYEEISDKTAEINTRAQENISGVRLVKAFSREKYEIERFFSLNKQYYKLNLEQAKTISKSFPVIEFLANITLIAMIIVGGYFVLIDEITIGTLVAFSGYIGNLIWPMRQIGWLMDVLSKNKASTMKINNIFDRFTKINSNSGKEINTIEGDIEFSNVSFKYDDELVLRNINLNIRAGSTVAIMGQTGSGKSTLLSLIGRYYDATAGDIKINGVDVKDINLNTLRKNMSVVQQDTFLFSDSVVNNLKFGKVDATVDDIISGANKSCALEFIEELQDGFNTEIGERGVGLSGGQKQRISIARAIIRNAPILILDDSTSALDMETEHQLLKNLNEIKKGKTTILVAHRISAVKNADLIVFMKNGEIVEKGTHNELIDKKKYYYNVYKEQFKDFNNLEVI
ncbi:ABC transporter ATP-binding protein [Clostridium sartagoforme]|uniref:ABC transporter ATP-binding protein n=1 Tax=Clostridium sartagoforme TaxID=84031 RepID=A0A4S2DSH4_9CLOT|nr:ABC transporter ATP-binding protein [Clostridium sartagoforme]TGY44184.1 ABC transporter ATP-binding protein [Clostridium sartagoforme]